MVNGAESLASAFASGAANSAAAVVCAIFSALGALQFCENLTVSFDSPGRRQRVLENCQLLVWLKGRLALPNGEAEERRELTVL